MKLNRISYKSAVFFGVFALIMFFLMGILALISFEAASMFQWAPASFWEVLLAAIVQGVSTYIGVLVLVLIYNLVAKKWPISWDIKK